MIVRVFRAQVRPGQQAAFEQKLQSVSIPLLQAQPGLVGLQVGGPLNGASDEYLIISTWHDLAALQSFVGERWAEAYIPEEIAPLIQQTWVHHYQVLEPEQRQS